MVTICWAVKGGSGTTVVVSTLALESRRPALLVDLDGEIDTVLGLPEPDRPGVADWLAGDGPATQLDDLVVDIDDTTSLLPCRLDPRSRQHAPAPPAGRVTELLDWFARWEQQRGGDVWVDAGTGSLDPHLAAGIEQRWMVTRACYLSLRRAGRSTVRPTGIVLVNEPGRQLRPRDVERSAATSIVATIDIDPRVARAVDAGLLLSRPPAAIRKSLRRAAA